MSRWARMNPELYEQWYCDDHYPAPLIDGPDEDDDEHVSRETLEQERTEQ